MPGRLLRATTAPNFHSTNLATLKSLPVDPMETPQHAAMPPASDRPDHAANPGDTGDFLERLCARFRTTLAKEEDAEAIAAFYREVWSKDASADSVRGFRCKAASENVVAPGEAPPIALVFEGTRVIGYYGSFPRRLWDGVAERPGYWVKGLMVLPEYRNGPIGFLLVRELAARVSLSATLNASPAAGRLLRATGYTELGVVPNFVRPLRGARLAQRLDLAGLALGRVPGWVIAGVRLAQRTRLAGLAGAALGGSAALAAAATRRPAARFDTHLASEAPGRDELDHLWHRARSGIAASPVRDGFYFRSRFGTNPRYAFVSVRDGGRLAGMAVVLRPKETSDPRLRGIRVATLSDILFPPDRAVVGLAVLGGVESAARAAGSDVILCSTSHRGLARLLRRQAYVRLPGNLRFFLRDATDAPRWSSELSSWWLVRGDGESDEQF